MEKAENEWRARSTDGLSISYSCAGRGKDLILFIHAWCCDRTYWEKQVKYFSKKNTVVLIDLGGHGRSGRSRDTWNIPALANDVISVINELEHRYLYLVGHSLGGMVALVAASKIRSRSLKLVLVDTLINKFWPMSEKAVNDMLRPFRKNFKVEIKRWVKAHMFIAGSSPSLVKKVASGMAEANPAIAIPLFKDQMTRNYSVTVNKLKRRRIPMHLLNSDSDETDVRSLKKMGFKIEYISSTGHFMMLERPIKFNKTLAELLY
jgi:pimeloyl-ACP methyl ester carboxylesterase